MEHKRARTLDRKVQYLTINISQQLPSTKSSIRSTLYSIARIKTSYIACLPITCVFAAPVKYVLVEKDGLIARGQDADNLAMTNVLSYDDKTKRSQDADNLALTNILAVDDKVKRPEDSSNLIVTVFSEDEKKSSDDTTNLVLTNVLAHDEKNKRGQDTANLVLTNVLAHDEKAKRSDDTTNLVLTNVLAHDEDLVKRKVISPYTGGVDAADRFAVHTYMYMYAAMPQSVQITPPLSVMTTRMSASPTSFSHRVFPSGLQMR